MPRHRLLALVVGSLYLATFATSIPALALKRAYLAGDATDLLPWALALELVLAAACVGTAVAFFPVGRALAPTLSLGFVASRVVEAATIVLGVVALLAVDAVRSTPGTSPTVESALVAVHDGAFLIGPGLLPAVNALTFGVVLFRARLVPRIFPVVGLVGAPLLLASALGSLWGAIDQVSPLAALAALPIALWEFGIGAWLVVRGFDSTRLTDVSV